MPQNCLTRDRETEILFTDSLSPLAEGFPWGCYVPSPLHIAEEVPMTEIFFSLRKPSEIKKERKRKVQIIEMDAVSLLESIAPGEYSSRGHRWSINSLCFRKPEAIKEKGGGSCG